MKTKLTLEDCKKIAEELGGKCLSVEYKNNRTKLLWQCKENHQPWEAIFSNIKYKKRWCPYCNGGIRLTLNDCHKLASTKEGFCLSEQYINDCTKMLWICKNNHQWKSTYNNIQNGHWCPKCSGNGKLILEHCIDFAKTKDGKCLSIEYTNSNTQMLWKCDKNHEWQATFDNIKHGKWCPDCGGRKKLTLEHCKKLAATKNGKCLTEKYINDCTKMLWECEEQHQWSAIYNSIHNGSWCPECKKNKYEKLTGEYLKFIFPLIDIKSQYYIKYEFNIKKYILVDYYFELKNKKYIVEYNGLQHYEYVPLFHDNDLDIFLKQKRRDQWLNEYCKQNNIELIMIDSRKYRGKNILLFLENYLSYDISCRITP